MEDGYRDDQQTLFEIEDMSEETQRAEIEEAKRVIREALENNPEKRAGIYFSSGKDSLLTACLAVEVSKELGRGIPVILTCVHPYDVATGTEWRKYLFENLRGADIISVEPSELSRFSVFILGIGSTPPVASVVKECNHHTRGLPLSLLTQTYKKEFVCFSGVRCEESHRRRVNFEKFGYYQKEYIAPIALVKATTLWKYLEEHLEEDLNISYQKLREYYAERDRDGCWFCPNRKFELMPEGLEKDIVMTLHSHVSQNMPNYKEVLNSLSMFDITKGQPYRTKLSVRKQWYAELLELQKKWGREILSETNKKIIAEIWNYCELRNEKIMKADFVRDVLDGTYKPLYPELWDLVFVKKGNQWIYRKGVIKIIRNESGLIREPEN